MGSIDVMWCQIVAEMLRVPTKCTKGRRSFEGCNFLLQLWAIEHFYKRSNMIDILTGVGNKIDTHSQSMAKFIALVGPEDWVAFIKSFGIIKFNGNTLSSLPLVLL